jgi:tetrapyrrole methylase family protein/MazG family protein
MNYPTIAQPTADVTIVGLGSGRVEDLTLAAWQTLACAACVVVRTRRHPCIDALPNAMTYLDCDDLYETHTDFSAVYAAIVERVLTQARAGKPVIYAVPGHPWVGEATTPLLLHRAAEEGFTINIIGGLSFIEPAFAAVGVDVMDGGQVVDAMLLARQHHPKVEVGLPLLVAQIYARWLASDVKLTLLNAYPAEHPIKLLRAAGTERQRIHTLSLFQLDHDDCFDHLTALYVPPLPAYHSFCDLQEIVAHLRAPEGCPWDREQTLANLRHDLLSECAELLEAIDAEADGDDNSEHIAEELGDLFLSATMMAQIAAEEGRFQLGEAMHGVVTKLIRRHPHVFGDVQVDGVGQVLVNWDAIKAQEKAAKGIAPHPLDGIPAALPALEKARELQSKAAKAGLLDRHAAAHANATLVASLGQPISVASLGQALWQLVALAKEHDIIAEDALREEVIRFRASHEKMEG